MSTKKSTYAAKKSKAVKKAAARPAPTHPSWIEMIKECIAANPEDTRQGVSRPHIKKFVEEQYKIQIDNAQNTRLSRAIHSGAEQGIFLLPKGLSGKVKLPPKNAKPADTSASKENKPAKVAVRAAPRGRPAKASPRKAYVVKTTSARKVPAKTKAVTAAKVSAAKKAAEKRTEAARASKSAVAKPAASKAPKKVLAHKKPVPTKKTTALSKRGATKKAVTGTSAPAKAKAGAAAKKGPTSKKAATSKKVSSKRTARAST